MLIERPPRFFRNLFPSALFRVSEQEAGRAVFLTFDDGPIPEATPWVLDTLRSHGVKATFFMVGDNVRRYPHLIEQVLADGHDVGNHTMHHVKGFRMSDDEFLADIDCASQLIPSTLFRPPHGWMRRRQMKKIAANHTIVMYDLVTRDYSRRIDARGVVENVKRYTRPGSIIVFHDSLKSIDKLRTALPQCLSWLADNGYICRLLSELCHSQR